MDNKEEIITPTDIGVSAPVNKTNSNSKLIKSLILVIGFLLLISYYLFSSPYRAEDVTIHFSSNDSLSQISNDLGKNNIVRYPFVFKSFIYVLSLDKHISAGDYLFKKDEGFFGVFWQVLKGHHGVEKIRITFKEGMTTNDMVKILADKIPSFRKDLFLSDARVKEGYLFPDTYFFYPLSTTDEILTEITNNFKNKLNPLESEIKASGRSLPDIIIMASILEKEASGKEDASIISGILWKRIKLGMALQVDAAPETYKMKGLPSEPISNPGLVSIKAAIHPVDSPYMFYLHDSNRVAHFAVDFKEHKSNIARYLK